MPQGATVIGAVMCRDEQDAIARCLNSLKPLCDFILVLDTGSTDDTVAIANRTLVGHPHLVDTTEWLGYATTRTELVRRAAGFSLDWILMIDADCTIRGRFKPPVTDIGDVDLLVDGMVSKRAAFLRSSVPWTYDGGDAIAGELHEYVTAAVPFTRSPLRGVVMEHHGVAADHRPPEQDLELLQAQRELHPDDPTWVFYVAQTMKALDRTDEAIAAYRECAAMLSAADGGLQLESVWYCLFQSALLEESITKLGQAFQLRPTRAEVPYAIAGLYGKHNRYDLALPWAEVAAQLERPVDDVLFVAIEVYAWAAKYEMAIALAALGRFAEAKRLNRELLDTPGLPDTVFAEIGRMEQSYPTASASSAASAPV